MGKYQVTTASGVYEVETEDGSSSGRNPMSEAMINPAMAFGANKAQQSGATMQDLPYVAGKIASNAMPWAPGAIEFLANRPIAGAMQGMDTSRSIFPKPATPGGERLGNFAGNMAMAPNAIEALQKILLPAAKSGAEAGASRLMNSVLKPSAKEITGGKNLGLEAAQAGLTGTKKQILEKSSTLMQSGEKDLQSLLSGSNKNVDINKATSFLDAAEKRFTDVGDQAGLNSIKSLREAISKNSKIINGEMSLTDSNQLKRDLYSWIKDNNYGKESSSAVTPRKDLARGLKEGIESVVPESKDINKKIGLGARVTKAIESRLANSEKSNMVGLSDILVSGGGYAAGGLPGGIVAQLVKKTAGSDFTKTKLAEALAKLAPHLKI